MPFVALEDIRPLIPAPIAVALSKDSNFQILEAEAAGIISFKTGLAVPASTADRPAWVIVPAAWIISKLAIRLISNVTPEFHAEISKDYDRAIADLERREETRSGLEINASTHSDRVFPLEGFPEW
jgi:hypothetical protein